MIVGIAIFMIVKNRKSKEVSEEPMHIPEPILKNAPSKPPSTLEKISFTARQDKNQESAPTPTPTILSKQTIGVPVGAPTPEGVGGIMNKELDTKNQENIIPPQSQKVPEKAKFEEPPHNLPVIAKQEPISPPFKHTEPPVEKKPQSPVSFRFSFNDQSKNNEFGIMNKEVGKKEIPTKTIDTIPLAQQNAVPKPFIVPETRNEPPIPPQKSLVPAEMKNGLPVVIPKAINEVNPLKPVPPLVQPFIEKEPAKPILVVQPQVMKNTVELKQASKPSEDQYREPIE